MVCQLQQSSQILQILVVGTHKSHAAVGNPIRAVHAVRVEIFFKDKYSKQIEQMKNLFDCFAKSKNNYKQLLHTIIRRL